MKPKKDILENFVTNHQDDFDLYEPSNALWDNIETQLEGKKAIPGRWINLPIVAKIAAVLTLAFGLMIAYVAFQHGNISSTTPESLSGISLKKLSPELAEVEHFYTRQIQEKMQAVQATHTTEVWMEDMEELDADFKTLLGEIGQNVDNEKIVEALIQNYRLKLTILENILKEISKPIADEKQIRL